MLSYYLSCHILHIYSNTKKNKVFFAGSFGFALLYFYTFFRLRPCWGGNRLAKIIVPALDVFHKGEKLACNAQFSRTGRRVAVLFFYALSKLPFAVIVKRFSGFYHSELMVGAVREPPLFLQNLSWRLNYAITYPDKHLPKANAIRKLRPDSC